MTDFDWSRISAYPESTVTCSCGVEFRSHARYASSGGIVSKKPCPGCAALAGHRQVATVGEEATLIGPRPNTGV